jgi:hypothetical protein
MALQAGESKMTRAREGGPRKRMQAFCQLVAPASIGCEATMFATGPGFGGYRDRERGR